MRHLSIGNEVDGYLQTTKQCEDRAFYEDALDYAYARARTAFPAMLAVANGKPVVIQELGSPASPGT